MEGEIKMRILTFGRLTLNIEKQFSFCKFNNPILDVCGICIGWITISWWYDDIPEGLKKNGAKLEDHYPEHISFPQYLYYVMNSEIQKWINY